MLNKRDLAVSLSNINNTQNDKLLQALLRSGKHPMLKIGSIGLSQSVCNMSKSNFDMRLRV